jgi:hypothetical protein
MPPDTPRTHVPIPTAEQVRQRLAETLREAAVLRRQLRVSEQAERERLRYSRDGQQQGGPGRA